MLLSSDNEVTIVDKDEKKIKMINDGVSPLRESDIIKAFAENKDSIIATSSIKDISFNSTPTAGSPNLYYKSLTNFATTGIEENNLINNNNFLFMIFIKRISINFF